MFQSMQRLDSRQYLMKGWVLRLADLKMESVWIPTTTTRPLHLHLITICTMKCVIMLIIIRCDTMILRVHTPDKTMAGLPTTRLIWTMTLWDMATIWRIWAISN